MFFLLSFNRFATSRSDLAYADIFTVLEEISEKLQRNIQPTIYSMEELTKRIQSYNSFIKRVLDQPKVWIIGKDSELPTG